MTDVQTSYEHQATMVFPDSDTTELEWRKKPRKTLWLTKPYGYTTYGVVWEDEPWWDEGLGVIDGPNGSCNGTQRVSQFGISPYTWSKMKRDEVFEVEVHWDE